MRMTVVFLGLLGILVGGPATHAVRGQGMEKKDKLIAGPPKSQFFALFSLPVDPQIAADEQLLRAANIVPDGLALLQFLGDRIPTERDRARLMPLVKKLSDKSFKVREQSAKELLAAGPLALPYLRPLLTGQDLETMQRANKLIAEIEQRSPSAQTAAAVRLLRERKTPGAIGALLDFLPHAANDQVEDELVTTVLVLTVAQKKPDPALMAALQDPISSRRALAALVLGREGSVEQRAAVRKLLGDKDAQVRFRAAQGLLCARDASGVPVLVELLGGNGPFRAAAQAEDLLQRLAGDQSPTAVLADTKAGRAAASAAWKAWWAGAAGKLDLTKSDTELFLVNTPERCKDVTRQFLDSVVQGNLALFQKTTDVPFNFSVGRVSFATREELDGFFKQVFEAMKNQMKQQNLSFRVAGVVTVEEYVKKAVPMERDYLTKLPPAQTRIVYVALMNNGNNNTAGIFVRVDGVRVRVIGMGQASKN